jgi:hypothetical protein
MDGGGRQNCLHVGIVQKRSVSGHLSKAMIHEVNSLSVGFRTVRTMTPREDKFKRLLLRFERLQQRHYGMKVMAYTLINLRALCGVTREKISAPGVRLTNPRPGSIVVNS